MRTMQSGKSRIALAVATALAATAGHAATVNLGNSGAMQVTDQFLAPNTATPTGASTGNTYALGVPGQFTFSDTFTAPQSPTVNLGTSAVGPYDFQDSYEFSVGSNAGGDVLAISLGLGQTFNIADLQLRLYDITAASSMTPVVGAPPAGSSMVVPWTGPQPGQTGVTVAFSGVTAGHTYVLDVAGIANGSSGGTYVGQLNLQAAPVPLPAAAILLLSGLGGAAGFTRRRG